MMDVPDKRTGWGRCGAEIFSLAPCPGPVWAASVGPLPLGSGLDLIHVVPLSVEGGWTVKSGYFALTPCCWVTVEGRPFQISLSVLSGV